MRLEGIDCEIRRSANGARTIAYPTVVGRLWA
jgi:hypothetical protein